MNLNKTFFQVTRNYKKIPQFCFLHDILPWNLRFSRLNDVKTFRRTSWKEACSKGQFSPKKISVSWNSSAANEERVLSRHPDAVISVPNLEFEDVEFEQPVFHGDLCDALQICNSVDDQMMTLTSTLALSPEDVEKRVKFSKVIESLLRPFFGKIKIQIFGSTINGFGFKGCDIDMSFETFSKPKEEISYLETPDVPLVSEVICGKVTPEEISVLPRKEQLLFIHTVLLEFYKETTEPIIFISAYVPVVRFYHDKYNLKCDLSCRNTVAFANSKLLYLFGKLDDRVIPLMMTIRYWAKHVEIIGKGLLFNTYTISLLVIHFFQTRNPPILPSAKEILAISDSLEIDDMDDKTFLEISKSIPPSRNTKTLAELLREFFFFYLYFDFTRVICPLIGGSVPRDEFFANRPTRKFRMNTICVQDPMLVSHNVADLVDYKSCKKFFKEIMAACKLLQDNTNFVPSSSKWGLLTLLDKPNENLLRNIVHQKTECFPIPLLNKYVVDKYANENRTLMTAQNLLHLLQYILLFECRTLGISDVMNLLKRHDEMVEHQRKVLESVQQKLLESQEFVRLFRKNSKKQLSWEKTALSETPVLEEFQKFNSKHKLILAAECKVLKNTWLGRDFVPIGSFPDNSFYNFIAKERHISLEASKQNELNNMEEKTKSLTFFFEVYLSPREPESSLLINFRPFQRTSFNPILGMFLKEYVPKLIKNLNEIS